MTSDRSATTIFIRLTFFFCFFGFFTLNLVSAHGIFNGIHLAFLGWSFFVMCLPFFGGGVLLYPLASFIGSLPDHGWELLAWVGALGLHTLSYLLRPGIYHATPVTHFMLWSLQHPWPYWIIFACNLAPVIAILLYREDLWQPKRSTYLYTRLGLIILSLTVLWYSALHDMIILSNIHS